MAKRAAGVRVKVKVRRNNLVAVTWFCGRPLREIELSMSADNARELARLLSRAAKFAAPATTIKLKPTVIQ